MISCFNYNAICYTWFTSELYIYLMYVKVFNNFSIASYLLTVKVIITAPGYFHHFHLT